MGEPTCARIGSACATDGWPTGLPVGRPVVFVDDAAAAGGDGSTHATAFRTITEAVAIAPDGAVIAIATGSYDEDLVLSRGLLLFGACVSGTRLTSSRATDADVGALELGASCGARNLAIESAERNGIVVRGDAVTLDDVLVHGARIDGIWAPTGSVTARSIIVRDMRPSSTGMFGRGAEANGGVHFLLSRAVIEGGADVGAFASSASTWLELEDIAIAGVRSDSHGMYGGATVAQTGGRLTLLRAALEGNQNVGVRCDAATTELTDVVVRDTAIRPDGSEGRGIEANFGATLHLTRVLVERNHDVGVLVGQPGTHVDANALVVRDTTTATDALSGTGVGIQGGATGTLSGVVIEASREVGLFVDGVGGDVRIADLVVRGTDSLPDQTGGYGIQTQAGAHLVLERALLDGNRQVGLFAVHDGHVDATDVVVRGTLADRSGLFGMGVYAQDASSSLVLTRARIERSLVAGVCALRDASVHGTDVVVSGVSAGCIDAACTTTGGGFGIAGHYGGTLSLDRFVVETTDLCGAVVGPPGAAGPSSVDLSEGRIASSPIGACVQADGYDSARLRDRVRYVDVGVPLQATSYALPDAIP